MTTPPHRSNDKYFLDLISLLTATLANTATKVATIIAARQSTKMSDVQLIMIAGSLVYGITSRYYGIQLKGGQSFSKAIEQLVSATATSNTTTFHSLTDSPSDDQLSANPTESIPPPSTGRHSPPPGPTTQNKNTSWSRFLCMSAPCALMIAMSTVGSIMTLIREYIPGYSDLFHQAHLPQRDPTVANLLAGTITTALLAGFGLPAAYQFFLYRMRNIPHDLAKLGNWACEKRKAGDLSYWFKRLIALILISSNLFVLGTTNYFNTKVLTAKFFCEAKFLFAHTNYTDTAAYSTDPLNPTRPDTGIINDCTKQLKPAFKWLAIIITAVGTPITLAACNSFIQLLDLNRLVNLKKELKQQPYLTLFCFALLCYPSQHLGFTSLSSAVSTIPSLNNWLDLTTTAVVMQLVTSATFDAIGKWFPSTTKTEDNIEKLLKQCPSISEQPEPRIRFKPHKGTLEINSALATALNLTNPQRTLIPFSTHTAEPKQETLEGNYRMPLLGQKQEPDHQRHPHTVTKNQARFFAELTTQLLTESKVPPPSEKNSNYLSLPAPLYFSMTSTKPPSPADHNQVKYFSPEGEPILPTTFWQERNAPAIQNSGAKQQDNESTQAIATLLIQPHHARASDYDIQVYLDQPETIENGRAPDVTQTSGA